MYFPHKRTTIASVHVNNDVRVCLRRVKICDYLHITFVHFYLVTSCRLPTVDIVVVVFLALGPLQRIVNKFLEICASHRHGKVDVRNRIHTCIHTLNAGERFNNSDRMSANAVYGLV